MDKGQEFANGLLGIIVGLAILSILAGGWWAITNAIVEAMDARYVVKD